MAGGVLDAAPPELKEALPMDQSTVKPSEAAAVASEAAEIGEAAAVPAGKAMARQEKKNKPKKVPKEKVPAAAQGNKDAKKDVGLGLSVKKEENFGDWYSELVVKGEMIEYYEVSGCYILRPWSYSIWESIKDFFDGEIKKLGVQNAYFPLFVPERALTKEKDHVEGFAAEVAWVTKSGTSDLEVPIAIRPTSETVMYPIFSKWIRSHRDLPLKLNQWCNVVRWEFKHPTPFIRSREFLWQEGHTAYSTKEAAGEEVLAILELYRRVYEELLAVPVIPGIKSELEKFAGGLYTTTIEAFIPSTGRGIQAATSHCLGQNFAKMFEIVYEDEERQKKQVWQNSWGLTTRSIGVAVMVHGDDKGLVLPPRVSPVQVVVMHVPFKDTDSSALISACGEVYTQLKQAGLRVEEDTRTNYAPGWKYNYWELKGVPVRLEIGPRDLANKQVRAVRRDTGAKVDIPVEGLGDQISKLLDDIQANLFKKAKEERDASVGKATTWDEFVAALNKKQMVLAPWCDEKDVEEEVKQRTKGEVGAAKTLCMPLDNFQSSTLDSFWPELAEGTPCFASGKPAKRWALWGRSY